MALKLNWKEEFTFSNKEFYSLKDLVWTYAKSMSKPRKHAEVLSIKGIILDFPECLKNSVDKSAEMQVNYLAILYLAARKQAASVEFSAIREAMWKLTIAKIEEDLEQRTELGLTKFRTVNQVEVQRYTERALVKAYFNLDDLKLDRKMAYAHKQLGKVAPENRAKEYSLPEIAALQAFSKDITIMRSWFSQIFEDNEELTLQFKEDKSLGLSSKTTAKPAIKEIDKQDLDDLFS